MGVVQEGLVSVVVFVRGCCLAIFQIFIVVFVAFIRTLFIVGWNCSIFIWIFLGFSISSGFEGSVWLGVGSRYSFICGKEQFVSCEDWAGFRCFRGILCWGREGNLVQDYSMWLEVGGGDVIVGEFMVLVYFFWVF